MIVDLAGVGYLSLPALVVLGCAADETRPFILWGLRARPEASHLQWTSTATAPR